MKEPIPAYITETCDGWYRMGVKTQYTLIVFGVVSVLASLIVSTFEPELGSFWTRFVAFIAAATTGLLSSFSVVRKNRDIWSAWRMLTVGILRYKNQDDFTIKQLIDTYQNAESLIDNPTFVPNPTENHKQSDQDPV